MTAADHEATFRASSIAIRDATPADAACIGVLCTQVYLATYATEGIRPRLVREVASHFGIDAVHALLVAPATRCLVAARSGHLLGFAQLRLDAAHPKVDAVRAVELERLYVLERFAGQGIGRALLAACEATAREHGATTMWLTAWVSNRRALAFYARRGHVDVGSDCYVFEDERHENRIFVKALQDF